MTQRRAARTPGFDLSRALADPSAYFAQPRDVLARRGLSRSNKLRLLRVWEHDARSLAVADGEGMSGGEDSMHYRVLTALRQLEAAAPERAGFAPMAWACEAKGAVDGVIQGTRQRPVAGLLIAATLGYLIGRARSD